MNSSPEPVATLAADAYASWEAGYTITLVKFVIVTAIFAGITIAMFSMSNITEIAKNFPKYRCNPLMMPFAASFGYDPKENFNFCINSIFNTKAAEIFSPIYRLLGQFTQTITLIVNATLGVRTLFANFFLSINNFIGNVRNKIQELLFRIRIQFMKMMNLMGKVYGTMFAVIFMGTSALTAANNVSNNDLVNFLMGFCFEPETPVWLADGTTKPIREIKIGDMLAGTKAVTSTFVFDGTDVPMVRIGSVIVSANHYVEYNGQKIPASSHPSALPTDSLPRIYCLNVDGNEFVVGAEQLRVADYDEHDAPGVVDTVQKTAEKALNGSVAAMGVADYSLGFDPLSELKLKDGSWKMANNLVIGDVLFGNGTVVGLVREECEEVFVSPTGSRFSGAQLVWSPGDSNSGKWSRASFEWADRAALPANLFQVLTTGCSAIEVRDMLGGTYFVRDYREVPLEEMETPYEKAFTE